MYHRAPWTTWNFISNGVCWDSNPKIICALYWGVLKEVRGAAEGKHLIGVWWAVKWPWSEDLINSKPLWPDHTSKEHILDVTRKHPVITFCWYYCGKVKGNIGHHSFIWWGRRCTLQIMFSLLVTLVKRSLITFVGLCQETETEWYWELWSESLCPVISGFLTF